MRQRLPGDEACLDLAHVMLIEEVGDLEIFWIVLFRVQVGQIEESVATLSSALEEAQKVHSDLLQVLLILSIFLLHSACCLLTL